MIEEQLIHSKNLSNETYQTACRNDVMMATKLLIDVINEIDPFYMLEGTRYDLRVMIRNNQSTLLDLLDAAIDRSVRQNIVARQ